MRWISAVFQRPGGRPNAFFSLSKAWLNCRVCSAPSDRGLPGPRMASRANVPVRDRKDVQRRIVLRPIESFLAVSTVEKPCRNRSIASALLNSEITLPFFGLKIRPPLSKSDPPDLAPLNVGPLHDASNRRLDDL